MVKYSFQDEILRFKVQVVPRASRSEIVGGHNGALKVRIAAPPVDGAANEELVRLLAKVFKVTRSAVEITRGQTARLKTVSIRGSSLAAFQEVLEL